MPKNNNNSNLVLEEYESEFSYQKPKSNLIISFNRVAFIFFVFFIISIIFSSKAIYLGGFNKIERKLEILKSNFRSTILDNSGNIIAKTVITNHVGIDPKLVINKQKLLINLKLIFPDKNFNEIEKKLNGKFFFYIHKKISQEKLEELLLLGDKSIIPEEKIARIYPQENLFSHIVGQIDDDNKGISGIEKSYDFELRKDNKPLHLTLDTNIQFLIREELIKFQKIFRNKGSASILMDVNNGNILSMVSLPDFNLNKREEIKDVNFINRATKAVYEFGSVFKTFTVAAGLHERLIETDTEFLNLEKKIRCGKHTIGEYDNKIPSNLTVEEILIRSGNVGSVRIGQKLGIEKFKFFLENIGVLSNIEFDIEEVAPSKKFVWGKCKLATASFGHGISTTALQVAKGYAIIVNGGFEITPTLTKKNFKIESNKKILNENVSKKINPILRKIVSTEIGTAGFANIPGYEIGGKTGTAEKTTVGGYSKAKVNTFTAIFPTSKPKYVLLVLLDEPKTSKDYIYKYRNKAGSYKGTPFNTAGWTSVEITGKIIEKIGPILATKY